MKFVWRHSEFEHLRRIPAMQTEVIEAAARLSRHAGRGYGYSVQQGKTRFRGIVFPETFAARRRNARTNELLKSASVLTTKATW